MDELNGKVWTFGSNINTDAIVPGQYLDAPMEEIRTHVLESVNPAFAAGVKAGDLLVAGSNFGCGSSREHAPAALKAAGIAGVVAVSFARIFFRNAIAIGLPVITCEDVVDAFTQGDEASVCMRSFKIRNLTTGRTLQGDVLSPEMREILTLGGMLAYLAHSRETA